MTATTIAPQSTRSRRNVELALLVFSVLIAMAAYASVGLAFDGAVPTGMLGYGGGLAGLFLLAHLALRRFAPYADPVLLPAVTVINGLGLALIYRLDRAAALEAIQAGEEPPIGNAPSQLLWTALGVVLFVALLVIVRDHRRLQGYTYTAMVLGLSLLLLPLTPGLGVEIRGAQIWIRAFGFSFQPGEVAKLVLIVFFASFLVAKRDVLALASRRVLGIYFPRGRDLGPILLVWLASLGVLVFQRDLGTSLLFFSVFVAMLYVATERLSWLLIGVGLFLSGAYVAWTLFEHVRSRVDVWLNPFDPENVDRVGGSFQLVQGLYGLANGGLLGTGLGQGRPDLVPIAESDFIVAAAGEELGLTGLMALLLLYAILVERGLRTAVAARDSFGKLLAAGLAFSVALQLFVVVGGVTRLIPLTGLTTPFLSYGGSSLISNWILVAMLLRISDAARRPAPPPPPSPDESATQVVRL
jgi:cell division protein FtsW (lipid II flippase)